LGILEIVGIIVVLIIVLSVLGWLIGVSRSKGSKTIKPDGDIRGKALVVYDPGITGGTRTAAFHIADELKSRGYEVKLAGARSTEAMNLSGFDFLVLGSPTYGAQPTGPVKSYLNNLQVQGNMVAGVYSLAGSVVDDSNNIMAQSLESKSLTVKVSTKYGKSALGAPSDKSLYAKFVSELLG
jgi:flavodoxin